MNIPTVGPTGSPIKTIAASLDQPRYVSYWGPPDRATMKFDGDWIPLTEDEQAVEDAAYEKHKAEWIRTGGTIIERGPSNVHAEGDVRRRLAWIRQVS